MIDAQRTEAHIDGARLSYLEAGEGEPVLLLHGYPQSAECWRHIIPALADRHRVVAPDWFGWGQSERNCERPCNYDSEVTALGTVVEALIDGPVNLIAHDYGGFLALGYAIRNPRRVNRLAVINSRAHGVFAPAFYRQTAAQCFAARRPVLRTILARLPIYALHRRSLQYYLSKGCFDAEQLERYIGWMRTPEGRRWYVHFYAHYPMAARPELVGGVGSIACPTSVIWGDRDPFCPVTIAEDLANRIPHACLHRIPGGDHFIMEERPDEVAAALGELLARPAGP